MMEQQEKTVLGVDVGWSETESSTAIASLIWTPETIIFDWQLSTARPDDFDRASKSLGVDGRVEAAAIDGPLGRDFETLSTYRTCEQLLTKRLQPFIGKPGQTSSPHGLKLNKAANIAANSLCRGFDFAPACHPHAIAKNCVVEAFPTTFLGVLLGDDEMPAHKPGRRSDAYFETLAENGALTKLLLRLLPGRTVSPDFKEIHNHDARSAVICAITALCVHLEKYAAVGGEDGWIILPPLASESEAGMQPWAAELIRVNAEHPEQINF